MGFFVFFNVVFSSATEWLLRCCREPCNHHSIWILYERIHDCNMIMPLNIQTNYFQEFILQII